MCSQSRGKRKRKKSAGNQNLRGSDIFCWRTQLVHTLYPCAIISCCPLSMRYPYPIMTTSLFLEITLCHSDNSFFVLIYIPPVTGMTRLHCTSFGYLISFAITEIQVCLLHLLDQTTHKRPHFHIYFRGRGRFWPTASEEPYTCD